MRSLTFGLLFAAATLSFAADDPWFSTFSIVAYDPATNELGVAVQSRAFGAGAALPYAIAGVGAVATQASANRLYGPKAIALLQQGLTPAEVVKKITDEDPGRERIVDIRVDDADDPFKELHRLLNLTMSGSHGQLSAQLAKSGKLAEAPREQQLALAMNPRSGQVRYALAQRYAQIGEYINAFEALQSAVDIQNNLKPQAAADPAFAKMKDMPEFQRLVIP